MAQERSKWRSSADYDYLDTLAAPDLAWEWLRRNSEYERDYSAIERQDRQSQAPAVRIRQRWGLRFPDSAGPQGDRHRSALGAPGRDGDGGGDSSTGASESPD